MKAIKKPAKKRLKSTSLKSTIRLDSTLDVLSRSSLFPDKVKNAVKILKESPFPKELPGK